MLIAPPEKIKRMEFSSMNNFQQKLAVRVCLLFAAIAVMKGQSSTGQSVTGGRDNNYQIIADSTGEITPAAQAFVANPVAAGWGTAIGGTQWIAPAADQTNGTRPGFCCGGSTTYRTTFAGIPAGGSLNVALMADDYVDVLLNGSTVFTHSGTMYVAPSNFTISSGFVAGTNNLDFVVSNPTGGPTGLNARVTVPAVSSTPVPPSLSLSLIGIAMMAGYIFFRKRSCPTAGF